MRLQNKERGSGRPRFEVGKPNKRNRGGEILQGGESKGGLRGGCACGYAARRGNLESRRGGDSVKWRFEAEKFWAVVAKSSGRGRGARGSSG